MNEYSMDTPRAGATVANTTKKTIVTPNDPGMASSVYRVQRFDTSAALPSTVTRTEKYSVVPHSHWYPGYPSCLTV